MVKSCIIRKSNETLLIPRKQSRKRFPNVNTLCNWKVKSRYATDCDRGFPVKEASLDAFDFLIVAFLNIGKFHGKGGGATGNREPEFFTLSREFVRQHHDPSSSWQKVRLRKLEAEIQQFKNDDGFELIAKALGVPRPAKVRAGQPDCR